MSCSTAKMRSGIIGIPPRRRRYGTVSEVGPCGTASEFDRSSEFLPLGMGFSDSLKYAVVAGAVAGGGLTVIANAPNPAGQSILVSRFGDEGISAVKLFLWAILPTVIMGAAFMLLR